MSRFRLRLFLIILQITSLFVIVSCYTSDNELQSNQDAPSRFLTYGDTPIKDCNGNSKLPITRVSYSDDDGHQVRHLHVKEFH